MQAYGRPVKKMRTEPPERVAAKERLVQWFERACGAGDYYYDDVTQLDPRRDPEYAAFLQESFGEVTFNGARYALDTLEERDAAFRIAARGPPTRKKLCNGMSRWMSHVGASSSVAFPDILPEEVQQQIVRRAMPYSALPRVSRGFKQMHENLSEPRLRTAALQYASTLVAELPRLLAPSTTTEVQVGSERILIARSADGLGSIEIRGAAYVSGQEKEAALAMLQLLEDHPNEYVAVPSESILFSRLQYMWDEASAQWLDLVLSLAPDEQDNINDYGSVDQLLTSLQENDSSFVFESLAWVLKNVKQNFRLLHVLLSHPATPL